MNSDKAQDRPLPAGGAVPKDGEEEARYQPGKSQPGKSQPGKSQPGKGEAEARISRRRLLQFGALTGTSGGHQWDARRVSRARRPPRGIPTARPFRTGPQKWLRSERNYSRSRACTNLRC